MVNMVCRCARSCGGQNPEWKWDFAVILFNMGDQPTAIEESFKDIGIVYSKAVVYDICQHKEIGTAEGTVTAKVESHGVAFYRLTPQ